MVRISSPLPHNTLASDTFTLLKEWIISGRLLPGERLVEARLAEDLAVSRVPVREALRQLKQEGLITYHPHCGYFVAEFGEEDLEELYYLRVALEKLAIGLAIQRMTPDELTRLERIVHDMEAIGDGDLRWAQETELDAAFHQQLCHMAHSRRLVKIWADMENQIKMIIGATNRSFEVPSGFSEGHSQVLQALLRGDVGVAEQAIERHLLSGLENLKANAGKKTSDPQTPCT